jgi:hypothetical protein
MRSPDGSPRPQAEPAAAGGGGNEFGGPNDVDKPFVISTGLTSEGALLGGEPQLFAAGSSSLLGAGWAAGGARGARAPPGDAR